jgi:nickel-dependent lactate racemase
MPFTIEMPYGQNALRAVLPREDSVFSLDVAAVPALTEAAARLRHALRQPIGMDGTALHGIHCGERVAIVLSDAFRHTGIGELLPVLVQEVQRRDVQEKDLFFLVATGVHRPPTVPELQKIMGEGLFERCAARCYPHDPKDADRLVFVGKTSRGTPVWLNRRLVEADRVILTGPIVPHYFAGFGGGRKSVVPGLAGERTIASNHSLNLHGTEDRLNPDVQIGRLAGNPVAEDMAEAADFVPVECIVNTVLNREGRIAGLFVGDRTAAHEAGCAFASRIYETPLPRAADLVIASAGAARNFVQSHKALFNAYRAMKPDGRIVFLTPCQEGLGASGFGEWLGLGSRHAVITHLRTNAEINGQTALSTLEKAPSAVMVTGMDELEVHRTGGRKAANFQAAVDLCLRELADAGVHNPSVCLMPSASHTVPRAHRADSHFP